MRKREVRRSHRGGSQGEADKPQARVPEGAMTPQELHEFFRKRIEAVKNAQQQMEHDLQPFAEALTAITGENFETDAHRWRSWFDKQAESAKSRQ